MNSNKIEDLNVLSQQLSTFLNTQKKASVATVWGGLIISVLTIMATIFISYGTLKQEVKNHINNENIHINTVNEKRYNEAVTLFYEHLGNTDVHLIPSQAAEIAFNSAHRLEFSRKNLDDLYASKQDLKHLEDKIKEIENKLK